MRLIERWWQKLGFTIVESISLTNERGHWVTEILRIMSIILIPVTLLMAAGWLTNLFPLITLELVLMLDVAIATGLWLALRGHWSIARYFPPIAFFLIGLYGSYTVGLVTNLVLFYAIAILLTGILINGWASSILLVASLIAYFTIGNLFVHGTLEEILPFAILFTTSLVGLSLLEHFYFRQLYNALEASQETTRQLQAEIDMRAQAESALRLSEEKFTRAFQTSPDSININRLEDGLYLDVNQGFTNLLGYEPDEVIGKTSLELNIWANPEDRLKLTQGIRSQGEVSNLEARFRAKDGSTWVGLISARAMEVNGEQCLLSVTRDITERKHVEQELHSLNRALQTLSKCNEALIHTTDEDDLLAEICRVIVEVGEYPFAWIGYIEDDAEKTVLPVATYGYDYQTFRSLKVSWGDNKYGSGPTGRAIRTLKPAFVRNIHKELVHQPWHAEIANMRCQAIVAFPLIYNTVVFGALTIYANSYDYFNPDEIRLLQEMSDNLTFGIHALRVSAEHQQVELRIRQAGADLALAYEATLEGWARTLEMRESETAGHSRRVAAQTLVLAKSIGIDEIDAVNIHRGALLHDIGKMCVPDSILLKPGPLTPDEWEIMRQHPVHAYNLLRDIPYLRDALDIPYCHHERWDGSGYPRGLRGEDIPIAARIFAIVDVMDALTSDRPYRPAWTEEAARRYISEQAGKIFDARIVELFLNLDFVSDNPL